MQNIAPFIIGILVVVGLGFLVTTGSPESQTSSTSTSVVEIPEPTGYVNDLSDVLSPEVEQAMENYLTEFAKSGKGEVAVLTLPTTGDDSIEQFGIKLGDKWKVGDADEDTGVMLIVATEDRQVRIEVGSGAEAFITDTRAGQILDNSVVPGLKSGDWAKGINDGVIAIVNEMNQE